MKEKGAALIEFALTALMFFTVLFAIIEFGILFWVNLTMQHAVREGARYAITGQRCALGNPPTLQQRYQCVIKEIQDNSMGLYDQVSPIISSSINGGTFHTFDPNNPDPGIFGDPGDIVVLQLDCTWPIITPLISSQFSEGLYRFSVAATMRNEEFSP